MGTGNLAGGILSGFGEGFAGTLGQLGAQERQAGITSMQDVQKLLARRQIDPSLNQLFQMAAQGNPQARATLEIRLEFAKRAQKATGGGGFTLKDVQQLIFQATPVTDTETKKPKDPLATSLPPGTDENLVTANLMQQGLFGKKLDAALKTRNKIITDIRTEGIGGIKGIINKIIPGKFLDPFKRKEAEPGVISQFEALAPKTPKKTTPRLDLIKRTFGVGGAAPQAQQAAAQPAPAAAPAAPQRGQQVPQEVLAEFPDAQVDAQGRFFVIRKGKKKLIERIE